MTIDLHIHSTISDGTMSPSELVLYAAQKGLSAISITDHDTVAGVDEAVAAGQSLGVEVVPGIELSVLYHDSSVHMLGYLFDHHSRTLLTALRHLQDGRAVRNKKILSRLTSQGIDIHLRELEKIAGPGECGRPHIAKLLLEKNVVKTMDEAFEKYLGQGASAYVSRMMYDAGEAIKLIRDAGGISILAHPSPMDQAQGAFGGNLEDLVDLGIDGIEVYYPSHSRKFRKQLMTFAKQRNLLMTGGSDFHGAIRPGTSLAGGKNVSVPPGVLVKMKQKAVENRRVQKRQGTF